MLKKILIALPIVVAAGAGFAYWYVNDQAKTLVDVRMAEMVANGSYDMLEYAELEIGVDGEVTMTDLHIVQGPMDYTLRKITLSSFDYANEFPRYADVTIEGLHFSPLANVPNPQMAALGAMLDRFGAGDGKDIPLRIDYSHRYDPDNAYQMDSTIHMSLPDSFTLDTTSVTRNIEMEAFDDIDDTNPEFAQQQVMALLANAEFRSMQMSLRDQGFLDDMLAMSAEQNGVAPADFRNLLISQATNLYLFMPPNGQSLAMTVGSELAVFLEGGKTLSVALEPEYDGNVQQLQGEIMGAMFTGDYDRVGELLHLEISAE